MEINMPNKNIQSYAERSSKSVKEVEAIWDETVEYTKTKFPEDEWESDNFWAYVNATVLMKLDLKTPKKSRSKK